MNLYNKNVLILGTGQVGLAVFEELNKHICKNIVIHSYSKEDLIKIREKINKLQINETSISYEFGDIYDLVEDIKSKDEILYTNLYRICSKWNIDIIIDCINTAAVLGEELASLNDHLLNNNAPPINLNPYKKLSNFIITLKEVYQDFKIEKYTKVSTTGLGGMGLNMGFTHGDSKSFCLSPDIMGKLQIAGAYHQLLWALKRTPGYNISVIVPSACIGWEEIKTEEIPSASPQNNKASKKNLLKKAYTNKVVYSDVSSIVKIPQVYLGENNTYAREEVSLLTQVNQMEFISKQRVAKVVVDDLINKDNKYNLMSLMDHSMISPEYKDFYLRELLIKELNLEQENSPFNSILTNNLGKDVSIDLAEVSIIKYLLNGKLNNINELLNMEDELLSTRIKNVFSDNFRFKEYLLSMNFALLFENEIWINSELETIDTQIDYIDCKVDNIKFWLNKMYRARQLVFISEPIYEYYNYYIEKLKSDNFSVGEILGILYSLDGKGREVIEGMEISQTKYEYEKISYF